MIRAVMLLLARLSAINAPLDTVKMAVSVTAVELSPVRIEFSGKRIEPLVDNTLTVDGIETSGGTGA
jgi:hypothetical protein